jgi:hypothetical protein
LRIFLRQETSANGAVASSTDITSLNAFQKPNIHKFEKKNDQIKGKERTTTAIPDE